MKVCKKCGAQQADERRVCVDCGAILGEPVDAATEASINKQRRKKIDRMDRSGDFLSLKPAEAVCGIAMLAIGLASGVICLFPDFSAGGRELFLLLFFIGLILGTNALTPKLCWMLEKLRLGFMAENTDELVPSGFYIVSRKLMIYAGMALVLAMFSFALYAAIRLRML